MSILEVLSKFNPRVMSNGEIRIRCPYRENHSDGSGNSSMYVNPDINKFHCFSCGVGGSLTRMLTVRFDLPMSDALSLVSFDSSDSDLPTYEALQANRAEVEGSLALPVWLPPHLLTFDNPPRQLLDRGFTLETLKHFRVGTFMKDGEEVITVPLYQDKTRLVGCKYRKQSGSRRQFWFSDGFDRERFLYNMHTGSTTVAVEGESDVWRSHQSRVPNIVATLGASVSSGQVKLLRQYSEVLLAYDNDRAGMIATETLYHMLKSHVKVRIVPYAADDPGDCPGDEWRDAVNNPSDYAEYSMEMLMYMGDTYEEIQHLVRKRLKLV